MKRKVIILTGAVALGVYAQRQTRKHTTLQSQGASTISANSSAPYAPSVNIRTSGSYRFIESNGIPNHKTGNFPNSGNPHSISKQSHEFKVAINPRKNSSATKLEMAFDFGVALNGVPFDPGAAEWYQGERNSKWQYEALSGAVALGVDENHAHVQPSGAYHYHGIPTLYLKELGVRAGMISPIIGYAADGFPIYALYGEGGVEMKSSYKLKSGSRSIGGTYDGTFVADYEYVSGHGNLDECNGAIINGSYAYFLTHDFPVIPRCFMGTPDESFRRGRGSGSNNKRHDHGQGMHSHSHQSDRGANSRGSRRGGPPQEAISACSGKSSGSSCSFKAPHGTVSGTCFMPRSGGLACRPSHHR